MGVSVVLMSSDMSVSVTTQWKCIPCNKTFKTMEMLDDHKKAKKHRQNEKAYRQDHPEKQNDPSSIFKSIQYESSNNDVLSDLQRSLNQSNGDTLDLEHEMKEEPYVKSTLESLRICLFCNQECAGVKRCLDHMRAKHNFIILDIECLINLKGLIAYIAERIQLGKMCLHCDKQFKSARRCQQHMMDMGHCQMPMDADEEFEFFYDFRRAFANLNIKRKSKINMVGYDEVVEEAEDAHDMTEERKQAKATKGEKNDDSEEFEEVSDDDWDDCDVEDGEEMPPLHDIKEIDEEDVDKPQAQSSSFQVVDGSSSSQFEKLDPTPSKSFTIVDSNSQSSIQKPSV